MNAAPVIADVFAFESVIVRTDVPLAPMAAGANAFATVAWESTFNVAVAAVAVPALVVLMLPVLFRYELAEALVTFTVTVHELLAGTVPPESATLLPPFVAVTAPPHVVAPEAEAVFTRPAG